MSATQKAVEDIKKLGRFMKGIMDAVDDLEKISSIEQAVTEAESRIQMLLEKEKGLKEIFEAAEVKVNEASVKAQEIINEAVAKAEGIVKDAQDLSGTIVDNANGEAKEILVKNLAKEEESKSVVSKLRVEIEQLKTQIYEKSRLLNELTEKIEAIRAKVV